MVELGIMRMKLKSYLLRCVFVALLVMQAGCSVYEIQDSKPMDISAKWIMLPFINHSDTPEAGERAADIAMTLFHTKGLIQLKRYVPGENELLPELNQQKALQQAIAWALQQGYVYAVTGSVQEWRYKSGLDAEPVAGITLNVVDLQTQQMIWSASGSRTGWGRENVSGLAHKLMGVLIDGLSLAD